MLSKEFFSHRLKELRLSKNISHAALGKELGVTRALVGHWESGIRLPSIEVADALADYFNVSLDYLVGRSDFPYTVDTISEALDNNSKENPVAKFIYEKAESALKHVDDLRFLSKDVTLLNACQVELEKSRPSKPIEFGLYMLREILNIKRQ